MQTIIKEYGESILAAVVTVLVIGLIFGGLAFFGQMGVITGKIDDPLAKEAKAASETALRQHMDIPASNIDMSGEVSVVCGEPIHYDEADSELFRLDNSRAKNIHISHVYLLEGDRYDNEGYDVTDQTLFSNEKVLRFDIAGTYRLVVNVTDSRSVVSDYQVFVTALDRRDA